MGGYLLCSRLIISLVTASTVCSDHTNTSPRLVFSGRMICPRILKSRWRWPSSSINMHGGGKLWRNQTIRCSEWRPVPLYRHASHIPILYSEYLASCGVVWMCRWAYHAFGYAQAPISTATVTPGVSSIWPLSRTGAGTKGDGVGTKFQPTAALRPSTPHCLGYLLAPPRRLALTDILSRLGKLRHLG